MSEKTEFILTAKDETQAAFNSVNSALSKMSGSSVNLAESFKGIGLAAVGLAGIASIASLKGKIDSAIEAMGGLKDASEATGASVENLGALKGVAKIGGRDFDAIQASIIKLNKALHGTDDESAGAGKALSALGLDLQALRMMDPGEAFIAIARAQEKFSDGGGKSAAMMAIMGKSASELIPYLHDVAEQQQMIGKVTTEQAKAADEYEKNINRLQASFGKMSKQMAAAVVGPLRDITDWMVKGQKEGGLLEAVMLGIGAATVKAFGGEINPLKGAEGDVTAQFSRLAEARSNLEKLKQQAETANPIAKFADSFQISKLEAEIPKLEKSLKSAIKYRNKLLQGSADENEPKDTSLNSQTFGKSEKSEKAKIDDSYDKLIQSIKEKIATQQLEDSVQRELTEGEKLAAKTMVDIRDGTIKLTDEQKKSVAAGLEELIAIDRRNAARKGEAESVQYLGEIQKRYQRENAAKADAMQILPESVARLNAELRKVDEIAAEGHDKLAKMLGDGKLSAEQFAAKMADLNALTAEQKAQITALNEAQDRMNASWEHGAEKAIQSYGDKAKNVAAQTEEAFTRAFGSMEDAVVEFAKTGKLDFSKLADSVISDIIRMQAKAAISSFVSGSGGVGDWIKSFFSGGSSSGSTPGTDFSGNGISGSIPWTLSAKGNVFNSPSLSAYSGSIVSKPTLFPFAKGVGLMGEAGPEAILPLRRGADGRLGISGAGGGGVVVNVINNANGTRATQTTRQDAGGKSIVDVLIETVKGAIASDIGSGGMVAGAMEQQYGLNRAAGAWR